MYWYLQVITKYAKFKGRAQKKEFWAYFFINLFFLVAAMIIDLVLKTNFNLETNQGNIKLPFGYIFLTYTLAMAIPWTAVSVRRLHDTGRSGWMLLVLFIPILGIIWLIDIFLSDGTPGKNRFGLNEMEIKIV